ETLGQENVRSLSVALLVDLMTLEADAPRAAALAQDMVALAEDLLMSGAYGDALTVARALGARGGTPNAVGRDACRQALDQLGESLAMRELATLIGALDDAAWTVVRDMLAIVGASSVESVKPIVGGEAAPPASRRAADVIVSFGPPAVTRLSSMVGDSQWFVQRAGARLLGRIAAAEAVPLLQPLLRRSDPRVAREAIAA